MNDGLAFFNCFVLGSTLSLSLLGIWFTAIMPVVDAWSQRFFRSYFIVFAVLSLLCIAEFLLHYVPIPDVAAYIVLFLESLFLSLPMPMLTVYLLHCCRESLHGSRLLRGVCVLWGIYFILVACAPFIGGYTYIAQDRQYARGSLYPLLVLPMIMTMLLNLSGTLRRRKRLSRRAFLSLLAAILPMTVSMIVHLFIDSFPLIGVCVILSGMVMYGLIMSEQLEQDLRHQREIARQQTELAAQQTKIADQQREIASQRTGIMVLQMRPHFIYNTLMSIYCLCKQDPMKARQATLDFTNYLRRNFSAIASETAIPFSAELEHTRAYLAVEQAQLGDMLFVEYDIQFTEFRLPPLTLQPIVENAVKHGRDPDAGPFRVTVHTRNTDGGSVVIVADNGRGFQPVEDDAPHTALKNIRERLAAMCGGDLQIAPGDSGGTVVTVTIPRNAV